MSRILASATPNLSEDIALHIRNGKIKNAGAVSPYFACLFPLLENLGWNNYHRDLIEALPHYASHLDLAEFRNVMVSLGYESHFFKGKISEISEKLLPALFVNNQGQVLLLIEKHGDEFRYFDGRKNDYFQQKITGKGKVYLFTDSGLTHAVCEIESEEWFASLIQRFKSHIKDLLLMTLILNSIIICVPLFIMTVYDKVIGSKSIDTLPYLVSGIAFALCIELFIRLLRANTLARVSGRIDFLIGSLSFRQIISLPPIMTDRSSVTAQLSKIREFDSIRDFFAGQTAIMLLEAPFILLFIFIIAMLAGWLAIIPVIMTLCYIMFSVILLPKMRRDLHHASRARILREQILMETFNGLRELKALGAEGIWLERFKETTADAIISGEKAAMDRAVLTSITNMLMLLSATFILAFGTLQVMEGAMSVGALIAVMTLSWRVLAPIQGVFLGYFRFETILNGIRDLNSLMSIKTESHGRKSSLMSGNIKGQVNFDRVSFKYGPEFDPALIGVSFNIPDKKFLAIVGHNGSGKSTILKLINGMYQMQSGTVYIDNIDTRQFNSSDLRRLVAYVPQNPNLFRGTIAQNLRLKDPLATDDDLRLACFKTGIIKMIESLPDGFNTMVGDENTLRLPGGLIRGICIARAFVRKSPILLLDEPGSGLDSDSDEALMLQLRSIKGQMTVIMVSHRPSHIKLADGLLLIERGMVKGMYDPAEYYRKKDAEKPEVINRRMKVG
ncbi:MAG: peptidase domain-containing ABC transporter [Proteobacteria bacterium]|nr:peptidase domain-containing ABC transporter [Pseudomonadota bacterium]